MRLVVISIFCLASLMKAQDVALFEGKILPLLEQRCFECHSHEKKIKGGLALDSRSGWEKGGESGPAIIPGKPEASLLIQAISHVEKDLKMPPKNMLPLAEIELLTEWVRQGAPDPRVGTKTTELAVEDAWEVEFQKRLDWWSLKPMRRSTGGSVDGMIKVSLNAAGLQMAPPASQEVLHRRLSFVLTSLPPIVHQSHSTYDAYVEALLSSPHFGEHFARHWMDVVRYTDTYGYEWDNPAKGSHEYRDYLIRAFNDDIGFDQLLREQIAGDLLPKQRIHAKAQTNESLIGPMFYHLGEHRHGSSLMFNGIHQEMVNNKIDAFSKAFLATTVACARCHDHKLEAVSQHDYYALAAMFTTPRWTSRVVDAPGKNDVAITKLKELRLALRDELAALWTRKGAFRAPTLKAWAVKNRPSLENAKPHDIAYPLSRLLNSIVWAETKNLSATAEHSKLTVEPDSSILATGGAPETDTYTVRFTTGRGRVGVLRLEALAHPSLPVRGPGRTDRGNFVLSELRIEVKPFAADGKTESPRQISLSAARASYSQPNYPVESVLKPGARRSGWAVGLAPTGNDHAATFTFAAPVELPHGGEWTITLNQRYGDQHLLGCFRLAPGDETPADPDAPAIAELWRPLVNDWRATREQRRMANDAFKSLASLPALPKGWVIEGDGMTHGFVEEGMPLIALEGETVVSRFLPRGYHTHALSSKLPGSLRMPPQQAVPGKMVSLSLAGGEFSAYLVVDDHAFQNETFTFITSAEPQWKTFADAELKNGVQQVTVEFATSPLNPNFPPRTGLAKGMKYQDFGYDKRSWLSITGVVSHEAGGTPQDELDAFTGLYEEDSPKDAWENIATWFNSAVKRWHEGKTRLGDHHILDWLITNGLLPNKAEHGSRLATLVSEYRRVDTEIAFPRTANSMDEREVTLAKYPLNVRGNVDVTGSLVEPASLKMLHGERIASRLDLAESLLNPEHPLSARVYVNRVWQWVFGTGLVATPDDFGRLGDKPSHPELLDWLAREFIREGWSTKKLVRRLVLSQTFRQSSIVTDAAKERDPANRLLHHYPTRRLEAEAIRDSLLAVSGRLDPQLYGRPILPFRSAEDGAKRLFTGPLDGNGRRSIYLQMSIMDPPKFLVGFNLPDLKLPTGRRDVTNVPSQALIMLNDPFVNAMAKHWSAELMKQSDVTAEIRVRHMFVHALGREPNASEQQRWLAALKDFGGNTPDAWERLAHAFFNTKEFIYYR